MAATESLSISLAGRRRLLAIARDAILQKVTRGSIPAYEHEAPELNRLAGVFVSLMRDGELRGSRGTVDADTPLARAVAEMAVAAATTDERFPAIRGPELRYAELEITVLGPIRPARGDDVVIGEHGLYIARGPNRSVLLPQVPTQLGWSRERFLEEACLRARLDAGAWREAETRVHVFSGEVFTDADVLDLDMG